MTDRLARIEDALARGRRVDRAELEWMLGRLRVLERLVCDYAWSHYEACPTCEAQEDHEELADCLCDEIGSARLEVEERLLEAARERLPRGRRNRRNR